MATAVAGFPALTGRSARSSPTPELRGARTGQADRPAPITAVKEIRMPTPEEIEQQLVDQLNAQREADARLLQALAEAQERDGQG